MANLYHKRSDIVNRRYYKIPQWIHADFSGIKAREIVIKVGDRLDVIADREYGRSSYWRALALFNNLGYAFDLEPGKVFRLPYKIKDVLERI